MPLYLPRGRCLVQYVGSDLQALHYEDRKGSNGGKQVERERERVWQSERETKASRNGQGGVQLGNLIVALVRH